MPAMCKVPQAADEYGIPRRTVWWLVLSGRLASYKVGRSRYVTRDDIDAYLATCREAGGRRVAPRHGGRPRKDAAAESAA